VAHTAWHWLLERGALLMQYRLELPAFDAAFMAGLARGLAAIVATGVIGWGAHALARRWRVAPALELDNPTVSNE
jgi:hypothetical protein